MPHASVAIEDGIAEALSFPKREYRAVELERRWVCRYIPAELVVDVEYVVDLYVSDTRMRLRESTFRSGAAPMRRLTRKVDVDPATRLMTSIYLPEDEYRQLQRCLSGRAIRKRRHRLAHADGIAPLIDEYQDELEGLLLAEVEFGSRELLETYQPPSWLGAEITGDLRYTGGRLAHEGRPIGT